MYTVELNSDIPEKEYRRQSLLISCFCEVRCVQKVWIALMNQGCATIRRTRCDQVARVRAKFTK